MNVNMKKNIRIGVAAIVALVAAWSPAAVNGKTDWNQWRGPDRNGVAPAGPKLADVWGPSGPALVWKSEERIPGGPKKGGSFSNYGSPVVAQGRVYLYVHDQAASADLVYCLDAHTGKTLWKASYPGSPNGGGSSTPYVGGGKVYAVGTQGMYCLDAETGREVWKTPSLVLDVKGDGINSSPAIVDGVLVVCGGSGKHFNPKAVREKESGVFKGFNLATGKELWSCPQATADVHRNGDKSASVAVWNTDQGPRLITGTGKLTCVNPKDGSVIWQDADGVEGGTAGTPAIFGDVCVHGQRMKGYRLGLDKAERLFSVDVGDRVGSYLLHDGHVFADCYGTYRYFDLTGKILWQKTAGKGTSSPILADGKVFHIVGNKMFMFRAAPTLPETFFEADISAQANTSPALCGGRLYIRLADGVACYDLTRTPADVGGASQAPAPATAPATALAAKRLITFVDVSPTYFAQRKGITAQSAWPPEKEEEAATLDWALNKALDADGCIDLIALQDSRGMLTADCVAYVRVVLEATASGKLALALTVNKAAGDVSAIVAWVNGKNVLRQDTHEKNPEHVELVVDLVAGKNILLVRTAPTRGHHWKLQVQATALGGLVVRQVAATAAGATDTGRTKP
jgi:outer membrane protein assembly factor BamB